MLPGECIEFVSVKIVSIWPHNYSILFVEVTCMVRIERIMVQLHNDGLKCLIIHSLS